MMTDDFKELLARLDIKSGPPHFLEDSRDQFERFKKKWLFIFAVIAVGILITHLR